MLKGNPLRGTVLETLSKFPVPYWPDLYHVSLTAEEHKTILIGLDKPGPTSRAREKGRFP